jgi:hypothetical protein
MLSDVLQRPGVQISALKTTEEQGKRVRGTKPYYYRRRSSNFTAMCVPRQCPLVLLVKARCREGKKLGSGVQQTEEAEHLVSVHVWREEL